MRQLGIVLTVGALTTLAAQSLADPRSDYLMHCAGCHLVDARGVPPEVPSLSGPLGRLAASAAGRDYIARVPGAAQTPLSDDELAAVFNWLLLEYNRDTLPRDFTPISGDEVARSRAKVLADPQKLREQLWPDAARPDRPYTPDRTTLLDPRVQPGDRGAGQPRQATTG